ncbi:hypothetical protein, partial [Rhodovulum sulfidophilum]|uniref:hypothetical protein n=1 Tax=Rhodovulum sulfidophilum TaxID=35806 RepID=UPI001F277B87
LSTARAGGHPLAVKAERITTSAGANLGTAAHHALRLKSDHPMGAGQFGTLFSKGEEKVCLPSEVAKRRSHVL